MSDPVSDLNRLARAQHGAFRLEDARRCGATYDQLRHLLAAGWCTQPSRGIYRIAGAPETREQVLLVKVWSAGAQAVASHRAASRVWSLPGFADAPPEVLRPHGEHQSAGRRVHVTLVLPPAHVTTRLGIPITSPARTIFDVAGVVHPAMAERTLDAALQRRLCSLIEVRQVFFALARRGRRGTATMRELLEARGAGYVPPASELERLARRVLTDAGIPMPEFEVDLGDIDWIGRVDCLWRPERVIVELDGRRFHDGLSARSADRERDNRFMAQGWRVIRVTWDDLVNRPEVVVGWIRTALAHAA